VISLVVPTFNERQNIVDLVRRTGKTLSTCDEDYELIVVDDNSPDGTANEVRRLQVNRPWLKLVVRKNGKDLSTAVLTGWQAATGDVLGCMDGDLQHPPEHLTKLIARIRDTRADVVIASRYVKGGGVSDWKLRRRVVSWLATLLAKVLVGEKLGRVRDPMSGFFLLKRSVINQATLRPIGYKILFEVLTRASYRYTEEVPYTFEERVHGGSKMGSAQVWTYLAHLVRTCYATGEAWRLLKALLVELTTAGVCVLSLVGLSQLGWLDLWGAALASGAVTVGWRSLWREWLARRRYSEKERFDWRQFIWCNWASLPGLLGHVTAVWLIGGVLNQPVVVAGIYGASLATLLYVVFLWSPEFILLPRHEGDLTDGLASRPVTEPVSDRSRV
jgi:dolichol-phosphate mannosyltransferase